MKKQELGPVMEKCLSMTDFRKMSEGCWDGLKYPASLNRVRDVLYGEAASLGEAFGYGDLYPGITSVQDFLTEIEVCLHRPRGTDRDIRTFLFGFTARGMEGNEAVMRRAKCDFLIDAYRTMYAVRIVKELDEYSRERARIFLGAVPLGSERAFFAGALDLAEIGARIRERTGETVPTSIGKDVIEVLRTCGSDAELSAACRVLEAVTQTPVCDLMRRA